MFKIGIIWTQTMRFQHYVHVWLFFEAYPNIICLFEWLITLLHNLSYVWINSIFYVSANFLVQSLIEEFEKFCVCKDAGRWRRMPGGCTGERKYYSFHWKVGSKTDSLMGHWDDNFFLLSMRLYFFTKWSFRATLL